ncbi:LIM zinc finger domain containing protein [Entamoeba marina]
MSAKKCVACGKSAYPLERITASGRDYHKACFKCKECGITLNLKNFFYDNGTDAVYCKNHVPKAKATAVTDSIAIKAALNAPKKEAENIGTIQKGAGGKPHDIVFGATGETPRNEQPQEVVVEEEVVEEEGY